MNTHKLKLIGLMLVALVCPLSGQTGAHRIGQVLVKGNGIAANVVPNASIKVCVAGTHCSTISPVFSDQALTHILPQPLTANASGNYDYYTGTGCVDEQISAPGSANILLTDVCPSTGVVGTGSVNSVSVTTANGFQGTVANPSSAPAISISVDGSHYLPTITDESNWNGKQAALGFTPENTANKDAASGYAGLTSGTLLNTSEFPAFTGDATSTSGTTALTLATVNSGSGVCGNATHVCVVTTNAKGLVTSQTSTLLSGVTTLSVGGLSPLFTASVANSTTTPSVTYTQSSAPINSVFAGAPSGSAVAPTFQTAPTFSAANLTNFPLASTTVFGTFKPDGTTITCPSGVCSVIGGGGGMIFPAAGIAVSTGTAWTTSISASSLVTLTGSQTVTNKTLTSPNLTGVPTAPTATPSTNTTQVATTAYVATPGAIAPTSVTVTGTGIPIATGSSSNTDLAGFITLASGTGTFTFSATYVTAPVCIATDSTAANAVKASATTTVLTLTGTTTDVIAYVCVGRT